MKKLLLFFPTILFTLTLQAQIIYVDASATGANNGTDWDSAYTDLQDALTNASSGDDIWVATGTYYPTSTTNRNISFNLPSNVGLYGGFAGTEPSGYNLDLRDFATNEVILSGDIDGDGVVNNDNSYHVVKVNAQSGTIRLDGFTVSHGNASGTGALSNGGGIQVGSLASGTTFTIANCEISTNQADQEGGGIYLTSTATTTIELEDNIFSNNNAQQGGGAFINKSCTMTNCSFEGNTASEGGGLFAQKAVDLVGCTFEGNTATYRAGGIMLWQGSANSLITNSRILDNNGGSFSALMGYLSHNSKFFNCVFDGNSGPHLAIYNHSSNGLDFINCSFTNNAYVGTNPNRPSVMGFYQSISTSQIANCIFWGNTALSNVEIGANNQGITEDCIVEGGYVGSQSNVINLDPQWIDTDLNLANGSPAIDEGDNAHYTSTILTDINGDPRFNNSDIDLGAQESTGDPNPFVTTWNADNNDGTGTNPPTESVTINTLNNLSYSYTVDWGDGSPITSHTGSASHSYSNTDQTTVYTIKIYGTFPAIYCFGLPNQTEKNKLLSVDQWGTGEWHSMFRAFQGCENMDVLATDAPDLSNATSCLSTFQGCSSLTGGLSNWDVSTITDMSAMFKLATSFNGDISGWDVSSCTLMPSMFNQATAFAGDLKDWEVGLVTNMVYMFSQCILFNSDLSNWNVENVEYTNYMFHNCSAFTNGTNSYNGKSMNDWETINFKETKAMFQGCSAFNRDISEWDVSNVVDMSSMFRSATVFNADVSSWNVSSCTNMFSMFNQAIAFQSDLKDWEVGLVTNMAYMFSQCSLFNSDLSKWNVENVEYTNYMFHNCSAFTNGTNSYNGESMNDWKTTNFKETKAMFNGCSAFNRDISKWKMSNVVDMSSMFRSATVFDADVSSWIVSSCTNMFSMFNNASAFNRDLKTWDVDSVTTMAYMFYHCQSFDQSLGDWPIDNVQYMEYMLSHSGLSVANYDLTLIGWEDHPHKPNVTLGAQGLQYCASTPNRNSLVNPAGSSKWTINGDSKQSGCTVMKRSTSDTENLSDMYQLYPNPTTNLVNVHFPISTAQQQVEVYDGKGQLMRPQILISNNGFMQLDVQELASGVYYLRVLGGEKPHQMTLVKQ